MADLFFAKDDAYKRSSCFYGWDPNTWNKPNGREARRAAKRVARKKAKKQQSAQKDFMN